MSEQVEKNEEYKNCRLNVNEDEECFDTNISRLDSFNSNSINTTYGYATTACHNNRHSPNKPKKLFQDFPQPSINNICPYNLNGFTKISLPTTQSVNSVASLPRCVCDPSEGVNLAPLSPLECSKNVSGNGSPNYENMRKFKSFMKEMNQCMDEIVPNEMTCEDYERCNGDEKTVKCGSVTDTEEAVSIERVGDCLIFHFSCPCERSYQFLHYGNSCYYKLM